MIAAAALAVAAEKIEIIREAEGLARLGEAWHHLWLRAEATIFQSHAWISGWWNNIPDRDQRGLVIATAWKGDRLVAVLPLALHPYKGLRLLEWAGRDVCDYCDAIVAPDAAPDVLHRLWAEATAATRYDVSLLNRLLPGARAWDLRQANGAGQRLADNRRLEHSMRVTGDWASGEAWFNHFPKKIRQNYKRGVKFLEEGADLRFRLLPPEEDFEPVLAELSRFKRIWLQKTGIIAPLFDKGAPLLAGLVRVLHETGMLRIFVLERHGRTIAISMNFVEGKSLHAFVTAYDPSVERGSPGMVLMMDYIRWAFDHGLNQVDFLTGDEDFKNRLADEAVPLASIAGTGSMLGRVAMLADDVGARAWEKLHQWRHLRNRHPP